jgi:redox-sensitive bicupin YhaK (pirin superfamily)
MSSLLIATASVTALERSCGPLMKVQRVVRAGKTHPFGDERTVDQAFPSSIPAEEADPFLMCDYFEMESKGLAKHEDDFPVNWHPHRGFDILSYLKSGVGRHGDSLGNREMFETPGMQWCSCGSGIEHAEGGGTPAGVMRTGFQIWVNVPSHLKMNDPKYGTHPPSEIPQLELAPGVKARVLAGSLADEEEGAGGETKAQRRGPFQTVARVSMVDLELAPGAALSHAVPRGLNTALLYVYHGGGSVNGEGAPTQSVVQLEATNDSVRGLQVVAGDNGLSAMLFAGARLKQPIAWHGPIVMNTQAELRATFEELRMGTFPPKRVPWDYKRAAARPPEP